VLDRLPFTTKLMLAVVLAVLVAVGAVAVTVNLAVVRHFSDYVSVEMQPRVAALLPALAEYYQNHGDWSGVQELLDEARMAGMGRGRIVGRMGAGAMQFVLADATGRVVVDPSGRFLRRRLRADILQRSLPIEVRERTVGYLMAGDGPREQEFSARLNASILRAGVVASLVAIVLGLLLTGTALKPLRTVRDAARRIGAGDLAYRVPIASRDEVGEVALQFNEMAAALERDERLRRALMADIAHELRTPLAVIRGQAEALQDGVFELTPENIAPIYDQSILLGRLVDDLRDLALAEAGSLPLERAQVALDELASRAVAAFQPQAREKGVALSLQVEPAAPGALPTVDADPQRLAQVLGNLLSNALRYTPSGGSVVVKVTSDPKGVSLAVADTGIGIAPEDLPHVFDRFYRADKARTRADGGTGLGLAVARQLVEAHGGQITVQSEPGHGSTFTVRLPRQRPTSSVPG